jgi:hypothetical protein
VRRALLELGLQASFLVPFLTTQVLSLAILLALAE